MLDLIKNLFILLVLRLYMLDLYKILQILNYFIKNFKYAKIYNCTQSIKDILHVIEVF